MAQRLSQGALAAALAKRCDLPRGQAEALVGAVLVELGFALARGESAELRGLGSFICRSPRRRRVRDVCRGTLRTVAAGSAVVFRPGRLLRQRLAGLVAEAPAGPSSAASHPQPIFDACTGVG